MKLQKVAHVISLSLSILLLHSSIICTAEDPAADATTEAAAATSPADPASPDASPDPTGAGAATGAPAPANNPAPSGGAGGYSGPTSKGGLDLLIRFDHFKANFKVDAQSSENDDELDSVDSHSGESGATDDHLHLLDNAHMPSGASGNNIDARNNGARAGSDEKEGGEFSETPGGSFPKEIGFTIYDNEPSADANGALLNNEGEIKPRILLMGLRRSGKSSIQKVVFHKMSPNETLFLESTNKIVKEDIANSSFVQFHVWDFPGQIDFFDPTFDSDMIFGGCGALIFVIDAQDDYMEALERLHTTATRAYKCNPRINFEVFIHKVDGLSEDYKMETQRDIHQRATESLVFSGYQQVHLSFHLTSIYDHSIFEAFSKVVQKLIPQLPTLENLLNIFISNSSIEKAFLFDVVSKIYIATDSSPVDMQSYELCCDMIDVVIDVSSIYGLNSADDLTPAFDKHSHSSIKLNNGTILILHEVNRFLALVCILRDDAMEKQGMIEYNFAMFRQGIQKVFEVRKTQARAIAHKAEAAASELHAESPP